VRQRVRGATLSNQNKVNVITWFILVGFAVSVFWHYAAGAYEYMLYPYNTFLFSPKASFLDFVYPYYLANNPYEFRPIEFTETELEKRAGDPTLPANMVDQGIGGPLYFPVAYRMAWLFALFAPGFALVLFLTLFTGFFFYICWRTLKPLGAGVVSSQIFILVFLSYPFLMAFDRANFEVVLFAFLYLFAIFYTSRPKLSLVFLALAIAMKGIPAIFLILYLADKKYRELLITCGLVVGMTLLGYATYPGGLVHNLTNHLINLSVSNQSFTTGNGGFYFGNSLYGAYKFITLVIAPTTDLKAWTDGFQIPYLILSGILFCGVTAYLLFYEKVFWKKMALLICMMNLLPSVSGDYKLIHLFIPILLFIKEPPQGWLDKLYTILFALLLIPKDYTHLPLYPEASSSILLSPLLMLLLVLVIITSGIK